MCAGECQELHVSQLGPMGQLAAKIIDVGLETLERRNGTLPPLPGEFTNLVKLLAAGSSSGLASVNVFSLRISPPGERMLSASVAASALDVTPRQVRRLAARGRFAGARRAGRDWLIPVAAIEDYRRSRAA